MTVDLQAWQQRLEAGIRRRQVPGASVAVWAGGELIELAAGVLSRATGVEATTDSLFQVGSITKVWTATLIMQLIAEGKQNKEIAALLNLSVKTIEFHRSRLMTILGVHTIAELTRYAMQDGLVSPTQ